MSYSFLNLCGLEDLIRNCFILASWTTEFIFPQILHNSGSVQNKVLVDWGYYTLRCCMLFKTFVNACEMIYNTWFNQKYACHVTYLWQNRWWTIIIIISSISISSSTSITLYTSIFNALLLLLFVVIMLLFLFIYFLYLIYYLLNYYFIYLLY